MGAAESAPATCTQAAALQPPPPSTKAQPDQPGCAPLENRCRSWSRRTLRTPPPWMPPSRAPTPCSRSRVGSRGVAVGVTVTVTVTVGACSAGDRQRLVAGATCVHTRLGRASSAAWRPPAASLPADWWLACNADALREKKQGESACWCLQGRVWQPERASLALRASCHPASLALPVPACLCLQGSQQRTQLDAQTVHGCSRLPGGCRSYAGSAPAWHCPLVHLPAKRSASLRCP